MVNGNIFQKLCDDQKCERYEFPERILDFPFHLCYDHMSWNICTPAQIQSPDQRHSDRAVHFIVQRQTINILRDNLCSRWHGWRESSWRQHSEHPCMVMVWLMLCGGRDVSWPRSRSSITQCKSGLRWSSRGIFTCCRPWKVFGCCHGCRQWQQ